MQDGKKKSKKKKVKITKANLAAILRKYDIPKKDDLHKFKESIPLRYKYKQKLFDILDMYLGRVSSLKEEEQVRRLRNTEIRLIRDHSKGGHSVTFLRSAMATANYADKYLQNQGGADAFFHFLEYTLKQKDVTPYIYVRLASFMKTLYTGLGPAGAYKWFEIIEEQAKNKCPRELIENYAVMSTRHLDAAVRNWSGINDERINEINELLEEKLDSLNIPSPIKKDYIKTSSTHLEKAGDTWSAVTPKAIKSLIYEAFGNKHMRGREGYFLELALSVGPDVARKFIDDTMSASLETFLLFYSMRNRLIKKEDDRTDQLIAAKLADFADSIKTLEDKVQEQIAAHADSIINVDPADLKYLNDIIATAHSIKDEKKLLTTMEYAEKFATTWRYEKHLLEKYLAHARKQAPDKGDIKEKYLEKDREQFADYQAILFRVYAQEKKKDTEEEDLFDSIKERLHKTTSTHSLNLKDECLSAGDEFINKALYNSENGSQNLLKFLENYAQLFKTATKQKFVKEFIDSILYSETNFYKKYLPYLGVLTDTLSAFGSSFGTKEKFKSWEKMIEDRFDQKDKLHIPDYIKHSFAAVARADMKTIEEALEIKNSIQELKKQSKDKKISRFYMPSDFFNPEVIFLNAKKSAGDRIKDDLFMRFFEFCCNYYGVVRPTILRSDPSKDSTRDIRALIEHFANIPLKEQEFYLDRAVNLFEEHREQSDRILKKQEEPEAVLKPLKDKLENEWQEARDSLRKLVFSYFKNIPSMIRKLGPKTARQWTDVGITPKSLDDAIKYFAQRSYTSELSRDKLLKGLKFEDVSGGLHKYAEALSNKRLSFDKTDSIEVTSSMEEGKILLPMAVHAFGEDHDSNYSIYKALTSYQTAFIEFGTYQFDEEIAKKLMKRNEKDNIPDEVSLSHLMNSYANAPAASYIFTLLETARVKSLLLEEYPGLKKDMHVLDSYLAERMEDDPECLPKKGILLEILYQVCLAGSPLLNLKEKDKNLAESIAEAVDSIRKPEATVNDTLELTDKLYGLMGVEALDKITSAPAIAKINLDEAVAGKGYGFRQEDESIETPKGPYIPFPEWDINTGRSKGNFVHVYERPIEIIESDEFALKVLKEDYQDLEKIRRQFEALRPEEFKTLKKQLSGDPDFDRIVEAKAMIKAGVTPSEKLFMRRYKNQRSVATLFLTELSGSLRKFLDLDNPTTRLIDIHKKTCVYMCEALDKIGDAYAIYGYSGKTREKVDTFLIKGFDESYDGNILQRVSSLRPMQQNRDGAGIRYGTHILNQRPEKIKILVYLLEGVPADFEYKGDYAISDTREALRDARTTGLHPVVIFIGDSNVETASKIGAGFRFAHVADLSDVPAKLPDIYRRMTT